MISLNVLGVGQGVMERTDSCLENVAGTDPEALQLFLARLLPDLVLVKSS